MISHTAIPSESEKREEKDDLHLFLVIPVINSMRHLPLGDFMFTRKRENVMKAACRLSYSHTFALFTTGMNGSPHRRECIVIDEPQGSVRE